jgi:hypothetical protein
MRQDGGGWGIFTGGFVEDEVVGEFVLYEALCEA